MLKWDGPEQRRKTPRGRQREEPEPASRSDHFDGSAIWCTHDIEPQPVASKINSQPGTTSVGKVWCFAQHLRCRGFQASPVPFLGWGVASALPSSFVAPKYEDRIGA